MIGKTASLSRSAPLRVQEQQSIDQVSKILDCKPNLEVTEASQPEEETTLEQAFFVLLAKLRALECSGQLGIEPEIKSLVMAIEEMLKTAGQRIKDFNEALAEYNKDLEEQMEKSQELKEKKQEELEALEKLQAKLSRMKEILLEEDLLPQDRELIAAEKIDYM